MENNDIIETKFDVTFPDGTVQECKLWTTWQHMLAEYEWEEEKRKQVDRFFDDEN